MVFGFFGKHLLSPQRYEKFSTLPKKIQQIVNNRKNALPLAIHLLTTSLVHKQ
jgi:hypothetical protein